MDVSPIPVVTTVAPAEAERAIGTIVLAFITDPLTRWAYGDPQQYLVHFPAFVRAFGGRAFRDGTAHQVNSYAGAALWLPPGVEPDHAALEAVIELSMPAEMQAKVGTVFEELGRYHPSEPHWYLPLIGVDPAMRHRGYGSALLQEALRQCDQYHDPAYLESTNEANIPLYQRHGFEILGTVQVGSTPPVFPMLRAAR